MHLKKRQFILPLVVLSVFVGIGIMTCLKLQNINHWPLYSKEHILRNLKQVKNGPLVEELFTLHDSVKDVINQKAGSVTSDEKRANLILLTKICKDSCKAIRCRIDPGLGHACRQNCPENKVYFCILATKMLPEEMTPQKHSK